TRDHDPRRVVDFVRVRGRQCRDRFGGGMSLAAVVALGAITPRGDEDAVAAAREGTARTGSVDDPLAADLPESLRARRARAERVSQIAARAVARALRNAGAYDTDGPAHADRGIVIGTAFGCFLSNAAYQTRVAEGGPAVASPRVFAATVSNAAA